MAMLWRLSSKQLSGSSGAARLLWTTSGRSLSTSVWLAQNPEAAATNVDSQPSMAAVGESAQPAAARPFSEIPALTGWPVVGYIPQMIKAIKRLGGFNSFYHELQMQHGPIYKMKGLGNTWAVVFSGPEAAATLMRAEGKYPSRGDHEKNIMWLYKSLNKPYPMFFAEGSEWKRIRSAGNKQVLPRRVAQFVTPLCEVADELMAQLGRQRDGEGDISDIKGFMDKWSFQGVSYFVYGEKVDVYGDDPQLKKFMSLGLKFVGSVGEIAGALPLYRLRIHTKTYRDYVDTLNGLQSIGKQILEGHYSELKEAIASGTVDDSKAVGLLDQWIIEGKYSEEEALVLSCDMLAAGMDTTSNSATFLLYELAKHPELQDKLYHEITSVMGGAKPHPSWDDIQQMKLVRNSVKETMRLYLPVGILPRILNEDAVLNGYHVPAGTSVLFNMMSTGRDSRYFSNPLTFDPNRWDKKTSEDVLTFTSLPFGFGPRMCYGRRLAELELYILLSKIIPKFRLSTDIEKLELTQKTVLTSAQPVTIKLTER